ncbi:MAG: hypothetical protein CME93_01805 [Hyphomonadaceae bacterium]|nr:hypothetical protein [Hyphomonadaceae bacterium]OUX95836.1 MAG: hypothetical protein CBB77_01540 [Hyphomonas sp. TMED17]
MPQSSGWYDENHRTIRLLHSSGYKPAWSKKPVIQAASGAIAILRRLVSGYRLGKVARKFPMLSVFAGERSGNILKTRILMLR